MHHLAARSMPLRALLGASALVAALASPRAASASATFPEAVRGHLDLSYTPACALCHTNGQTGLGTVNTPFGAAMHERGLVAGDTTKLTAALDALAAEEVDSDGDGVPDVQELIDQEDPNGGGSSPSAAAPELNYGCFATIAKGRAAGGGGAGIVVAIVGAALVARRRRRSSRWLAVAASAALGVGLVACYETSYVTPDICSTGLAWTGGDDHGSPIMNPGKACITCHSEEEGPSFVVAGTVFTKPDEPNECFGADGVVVIVTGDDGKSVEMKANEAGNFYTELPIKFPYRAMVVQGDRMRIMATPQTLGDCNSCHTPSGANGAPGRITEP